MDKKTKKTKKLHYFTLDEKVEIKFKNFVDDNFINKSKLVEGLIIQHLRKNNIEIND